MNCPYCQKRILGITGFQEAASFANHLPKCRKNPNNIVIKDGRRVAVTPIKTQGLMDALEIMAKSGQ